MKIRFSFYKRLPAFISGFLIICFLVFHSSSALCGENMPENAGIIAVTEDYFSEETADSSIKKMFQSVENEGFPAFLHSFISYYPETDEVWPVFLDDLKAAVKTIYLEYYELDEGEILDSVLEILKEKVKAGVDVRVLYDAIGSRKMSRKTHEEMETAGIRCQVYHPMTDLFNITTRDHRKIAVLDGAVAYTGGFNLADQYFNIITPYGHWRDSGFRIVGDAVKGFSDLFVTMWNETAEREPEAQIYPENDENAETVQEAKGIVLPFSDTPEDDILINRTVFLDMLNFSRETFFVVSPYLMIDDEVLQAIGEAVERGVDIRFVTPRIGDQRAVHAVTKSYYPQLLSMGVRIFEYVPGFIHSKLWLADDRLACVGSINLDYLSFYTNHEVGLLVYESDVIRTISGDIETLFAVGEEILPE